MKMFRIFSALAFAGVCLSMASCIDSKNPVSDLEKAKVDRQLLGVWRTTGKFGRVQYYHVGTAGNKLPGGVLRAIPVTHNIDGQVPRVGEVLQFTSEIGSARFLNVAFIEPKNLEKLDQNGWDAKLVPGYILLKYEIDGDSLTLWGVNEAVKRKAIEAGTIKGEIKKNDNNETVYFTDTTENLAKFLADPANANLFEKKETYQRVK